MLLQVGARAQRWYCDTVAIELKVTGAWETCSDEVEVKVEGGR